MTPQNLVLVKVEGNLIVSKEGGKARSKRVSLKLTSGQTCSGHRTLGRRCRDLEVQAKLEEIVMRLVSTILPRL